SQSRALLGGDIALQARGPFPKPAGAWLDSLAATGTPVARMTSFASMALTPRTGGTRLVQVRAVTNGYPLYGTVTTTPADRWRTLHDGAHALVDRSLLVALDAAVGDTLVLGYGRFAITGTLDNVPGDPGIAAVLGPRVYIPARYLAETQLLGFGARADYEALLRLPAARVGPTVGTIRQRFDAAGVRARTVADTERGLTRAVDRLTDFLSIVGLIALLLGGVGVASGVSAFVARKIDTVAVLRCLGATSRQVLAIYVTQSAIMGIVGASIGAALGVALQLLLPRALGDFLPVDVQVSLDPVAIGTGILIGLWVSLVFALRPLLALRRVSPLQAIRRDVDPAGLRRAGIDWPRRFVELAVVASVVALTVSRAGRWREGLWLSAGIGGALLVLAIAATAVGAVARRLMRAGWPYVVRQGVANLYRPGNQTRAVTLALGFGAFLVSTIYLVQSNLLREFDVGAASSRANVVLFDIQDDQFPSVSGLVRASGTLLQATPIVTMRIASINGRTVAQIMADSARRRGGWAVRREFRSTYRDTLTATERLVAGKWFGKQPGPGTRSPVYDVSLDQGVAADLRVKLGDTITWDVQGVPVATRVTSLREISWQRFELNFFAVFPTAAISAAPKQYAVLARVPTSIQVARLQRDVVSRHPNVSSVDLSLVQATVGRIVERVSMAVRFLAIFSLATGLPVLFSAVAATRRDRLREGVLLKTLGATRAQILRVLLAEYAVLGALGAATGMVLAFGGAWALVHYVFEGRFAPAWLAAGGIALLMMGITVVIGLATAREVFRETPAAALREA
ncbi:MAG: FtsX-like permease family protein, partial [Gemmatirosa sp.]|nr:FtsX-like permease family protein [Gemmatirosa sp.]